MIVGHLDRAAGHRQVVRLLLLLAALLALNAVA